ncbi:histone acetylation protein-domain-containing protein [Lipomyces tetrasporus]|uniref:histone acetyltransferase n=1 Tax=Lipomyces tetrasporus TaxID=54092 RepID=A0AAD7R199_9ASCO|nr:histone acetylation protein-domain-containing protein [Lipomyces tetrasporus]KAJ8103967.1 histone acetylation protein-domain-containing protein [Lipomyces tetrasporus]
MKIINGANFWSDGLAIYLPCLDSPFVIHHIATKPQKHALTQEPQKSEKGKGKRSISTQLSTHFLTLTYDGLHVLALELLVYRSSPSTDQGETENESLTTIFVSKADSSGYFNSGREDVRLNIGAIVTQILTIFIQTLARPNIPIRLCLFARAQPQYIFPESGRNKQKHVLSDRGLVKWWIRVTSPLLSVFSELKSARLCVPGAEPGEIKSFLLPDPETKKLLWKEGHIFCADGDRDNQPAVRHIPSFPDDPKSRFLDFLVAEGRDGITTVNQFFAELQVRQEFLLGFVAAIIGIEGLVDKNANDTSTFACPVVENKVYSKIHDAIVTSDYSTETLARNATAKFIEALPKSSEYVIQGTQKSSKAGLEGKNHLKEPSQQINVIGGGLVRKRTKPADTRGTTVARQQAADAHNSSNESQQKLRMDQSDHESGDLGMSKRVKL